MDVNIPFKKKPFVQLAFNLILQSKDSEYS